MLRTDLGISGLKISVNHRYDSIKSNGYTGNFDAADFEFTVTDDDIEIEREKMSAQYPDTNSFSEKELESSAILRKIAEQLPFYGAALMHGSAVVTNGKAYVFTAPSGAGKTTHSRFWLESIEGSYILNGDKPIIRVFPDGVKICGNPWTGKENYGCNGIVPLGGICLLSRGTQNEIESIDFGNAFGTLFTQFYRPEGKESFIKTLQIIKKAGQSTPLYSLKCNKEPSAALVSHSKMCGL